MKYISLGRSAKKGASNQTKTLVQWQERIFSFIFKAICIAALAPLVKSNISAVKDQLWFNLAAYNLAYLVCCLLIIVDKIPFKVRAWLGMGVLCSLGILSLFSIGPMGSGRVWLYATTIFATLVLGMRAGVGIMLGQSLCLALFYYLLETRENFWSRFIVLAPDSWATTSITLVFLNIVSVLAMGRLIKGLALSLEESEIVGAKLKETTRKLEHRIATMEELENKQREYESRLQQSYKMEAIGTLAGGIAHDFNNILFPIIGNTELLRADTEPHDSSTLHCLDQIHQNAIRAKDLVQQILTFSRHEETVFQPIKLQPIVKETIKMLRSTIPKHIDIKQDIYPDCPAVNADATQIHQIIMNLATNAYHAIGNNSGEVSIQLKTCRIEKADLTYVGMTPGKFVCLCVSDNGGGIAPEHQEKIFDPFFTSKEKGRGTGMGLSVVHGIVQKMHGCIHVDSEPGHGAEFKIYLPVAENRKIEEMPDEKMPPALLSGTERILLVDDENAILAMEKVALEKKGYKVTTQIDPIKALELFAVAPYEFDLVISDMSMPRMPGHKFVQELLAVRPDIPIIICTGFSEKLPLEAAVKMGVKEIVHKPVQISDLLEKIRTLLDSPLSSSAAIKSETNSTEASR